MDLIEPQQAILEMNFRDDRNLTASAMSEDGHWIAVADIEEVKLFRIDENVSNNFTPSPFTRLYRVPAKIYTLMTCSFPLICSPLFPVSWLSRSKSRSPASVELELTSSLLLLTTLALWLPQPIRL